MVDLKVKGLEVWEEQKRKVAEARARAIAELKRARAARRRTQDAKAARKKKLEDAKLAKRGNWNLFLAKSRGMYGGYSPPTTPWSSSYGSASSSIGTYSEKRRWAQQNQKSAWRRAQQTKNYQWNSYLRTGKR
ncbi:MAG: hypothetical protein ACI9OJ_001658 [Myxococcota bacterium]|jgi:hypothetical protein